MNFFKLLFFFLLTVIPAWATDTLIFNAQVKAEQITGSVELGNLQMEDLGTISFTANKDGNQITVQAAQTDGTVVGKAETVVGLDVTPLYIMTSRGLKQLTIHWGTDSK